MCASVAWREQSFQTRDLNSAVHVCNTKLIEADKMIQQIKAPAAKPDNLSLIPEIQMVEGKKK